MRVTGERTSTSAGGFNPTYQRHRANYALAAGFLGPGDVLDLGCGVGHSIDLLEPRRSVGLDRDAGALRGQPRHTVLADIREPPLPEASFESVVCSHAVEHVPDPERVLAGAARVLRPGGVAVFTTPNRLTFGPPGEIVDPYHCIEWAPAEFMDFCRRAFESVELHGIFGSDRYGALVAEELRRVEALLRLDPLGLRHRAPRRLLQAVYDVSLRLTRRRETPEAAAITMDDFELRSEGLEECLDLLAVCREPLVHERLR